jgi:hypothetical protein
MIKSDIKGTNKMNKKDQSKDKRLRKTYGITIKEWNKKLKEQGNVCAVCNTIPPSGILNTDHLHALGFKKMAPKDKKKYVRGLLCFLCNTSLGKLERTKKARLILEGLVRYASKYKLKGDL